MGSTGALKTTELDLQGFPLHDVYVEEFDGMPTEGTPLRPGRIWRDPLTGALKVAKDETSADSLATEEYVTTHGGGAVVFPYDMPGVASTAVIDHTLGRDPVMVQVLVDGVPVEEYSVSFPISGQRVMVGFDIPAQAQIRLL